MSSNLDARGPLPRFLPQLEGLRAVAALGVLLTHVAFQTGVDPKSFGGAVLARFDFFVSVFFSLSAFLLWRNFRSEGYYLRRCARILPAYWVYAVAVLLLLPEAFGTPWGASLATLTFTQIYIPNGLAGGLTHLWSLCVEVAFYVALPLVALVVRGRSFKGRVSIFVALASIGLLWAMMPWPEPGVNFQIFPFSYLPWFMVGMIAAECEGRVTLPQWTKGACWPVALAVCWVAGKEWYGPLGLVHPTPVEFTLRLLAGTVFAAVLLLPYALGDQRSFLASNVMTLLGRWSYSLFLWHIAVLSAVFPILGIPVFNGHFLLVGLVTIVASVAVAAASYYLVEEPGAAWVKSLWLKRSTRDVSEAQSY